MDIYIKQSYKKIILIIIYLLLQCLDIITTLTNFQLERNLFVIMLQNNSLFILIKILLSLFVIIGLLLTPYCRKSIVLVFNTLFLISILLLFLVVINNIIIILLI